MYDPVAFDAAQRMRLHVHGLPISLPANELKRYLRAAGIAASELKQAEGMSALVTLAREQNVQLEPMNNP